jgi:hypothetical protein
MRRTRITLSAESPMSEDGRWTLDADPAVEAKWAEEIRSRVRAVRAGEMKTISIEQALDEADRLLADDNVADDRDR